MKANGAVLVFGGLGAERFVSVATAINLARSYPFVKAIFIAEDQSCHDVDLNSLQSAAVDFNAYPELQMRYLAVNFAAIPKLGDTCVYFLALHGTFGEDGSIQQILDEVSCRYTGSGVHASKLAFLKTETKKVAAIHGIRMAKSIAVEAILQNPSAFKQPLIFKPIADGSSHGLYRFASGEELTAFVQTNPIDLSAYFAEEMIAGREFSCGIYQTRDGKIRALEPVEIVHDTSVFDYHAKYLSRSVQEICPSNLDRDQKDWIKAATVKIHAAVGCRGYSRSDFILGDDLYFLEINTLPGLSQNSIYPKELRAEGINISAFISEQITIASTLPLPTQASLPTYSSLT